MANTKKIHSDEPLKTYHKLVLEKIDELASVIESKCQAHVVKHKNHGNDLIEMKNSLQEKAYDEGENFFEGVISSTPTLEWGAEIKSIDVYVALKTQAKVDLIRDYFANKRISSTELESDDLKKYYGYVSRVLKDSIEECNAMPKSPLLAFFNELMSFCDKQVVHIDNLIGVPISAPGDEKNIVMGNKAVELISILEAALKKPQASKEEILVNTIPAITAEINKLEVQLELAEEDDVKRRQILSSLMTCNNKLKNIYELLNLNETHFLGRGLSDSDQKNVKPISEGEGKFISLYRAIRAAVIYESQMNHFDKFLEVHEKISKDFEALLKKFKIPMKNKAPLTHFFKQIDWLSGSHRSTIEGELIDFCNKELKESTLNKKQENFIIVLCQQLNQHEAHFAKLHKDFLMKIILPLAEQVKSIPPRELDSFVNKTLVNIIDTLKAQDRKALNL